MVAGKIDYRKPESVNFYCLCYIIIKEREFLISLALTSGSEDVAEAKKRQFLNHLIVVNKEFLILETNKKSGYLLISMEYAMFIRTGLTKILLVCFLMPAHKLPLTLAIFIFYER